MIGTTLGTIVAACKAARWREQLVASGLALIAAFLAPAAIAVTVSPVANATNVCTDTPLSITFGQTPTLGTTGAIRIFRADGTLIDTIDLATLNQTAGVLKNSSRKPIGGAASGGVTYNFNYYPVIITGNTATIYPHYGQDVNGQGILANSQSYLGYGQTYYVLIDSGVLNDGQGFAGITDPTAWRFSTKAAAPAAGTSSLTVAAEGSGNFCSVQGAIDFVPTNNNIARTINVRTGTYTEIVYVRSNKALITVRGEDRDQTIIQYSNNNSFSFFNGVQVSGNFRALFGVDAPDFTLENITLHNTSPAQTALTGGNNQSEAFRGNNQRILLNRVNLMSFQDTLLLQQGTGLRTQGDFVTNSYIEGNVDFMWGQGAVFLQKNELKALRTSGFYTQIRNPPSPSNSPSPTNTGNNHGNVYVGNRLTRSAVTPDNSFYLGRIDPTVFPSSEAVFISNAMDSHIKPVAWQLNTTPTADDCSKVQNVHDWEYKSTDLAGNLIPASVLSQRLACSHQMTDAEAAQYSDPFFVIKWVPATINATPASVSPGPTPGPTTTGAAVAVNFSAPSGHLTTDVVGLYRVGASDANALTRQFASAATTGTMIFTLPYIAGQYEFRYFLANGTRTATSNVLTATASAMCDSNGNGTIDRSDVSILMAAINTTVAAGDTRDVDGDGRITVLDARACVLRCTHSQCAP